MSRRQQAVKYTILDIDSNGLFIYVNLFQLGDNGVRKIYVPVNKKLAPRPDGVCYCGNELSKCKNYKKHKIDCNGFTSVDYMKFQYLDSSQYIEVDSFGNELD